MDFNYGAEILNVEIEPMMRFSTFSNYVYLPKFDFDNLVENVLYYNKQVSCSETVCSYLQSSDGSCDMTVSKFPNFTIQFAEKEVFHIPSTSYIVKAGSNCELIFRCHDNYYYELGLPFMMSFQTIFDLDNKKVGIFIPQYSQGSIGENKVPNDDDRPAKPSNILLPIWAIVIISAGGSFVLIIIGVIVWFKCRR